MKDTAIKMRACWYNQQWNIHLEGVPFIKEPEVTYRTNAKGQFRLTHYGHDIYSFGYTTFDTDERPGHGGEWSSNSMAINKEYNIQLTEIGVDGFAMAIKTDILKSILPKSMKLEMSSLFYHVLPSDDTVEPAYNEKVSFDVRLREYDFMLN